MAFYRKNIGGPQQAMRLLLGIGAGVAAFVYLSGMAAWLVAASGVGFALTGLVGYRPMCAVAGLGKGEAR